ncbi:hypothetical protein THAOC_32586, partial [Thalassiosira oceanica]
MATGSAADASAAHPCGATSVSRRHVASLVVFAIVALCSTARHDASIYFPIESNSVKAGPFPSKKSPVQALQESSVGDDPPGREEQRKRKPGKRTSHDGRVYFVEPGSQLHDLVKKWKDSSITVSQAALDLNRIVSDVEYIDHKPSEGMLMIKTHKTVLFRQLNGRLGPAKFGSGAPYDVWAVHSKYDSVLFDDFLPSTGRILSIIRDPGNASVWNEFVLSHEGRDFFTKKVKRAGCQLNRMTLQIVGGIGNSVKYSNHTGKVQDWIEESYKRRHVLLVTERMVESMLVLWHEYNLHPLDVVFSSFKVSSKSEQKDEESIEAENVIREMSPSDSQMYRHANLRLDSLLGISFASSKVRENAIDELETMNDLLAQTCGTVTYTDKHRFVYGYDNLTINVPSLQRFCEEKLLDGPQWHHRHYTSLKEAGISPCLLRGRYSPRKSSVVLSPLRVDRAPYKSEGRLGHSLTTTRILQEPAPRTKASLRVPRVVRSYTFRDLRFVVLLPATMVNAAVTASNASLQRQRDEDWTKGELKRNMGANLGEKSLGVSATTLLLVLLCTLTVGHTDHFFAGSAVGGGISQHSRGTAAATATVPLRGFICDRRSAHEPCEVCHLGFYCENETTMLPCPSAEFFCPLGSVAPVRVKQGFYSLPLATNHSRHYEEPCPEGFFCTNCVKTICLKGYYCGREMLTVPVPRGEEYLYCQEGSVRPQLAKEGWFTTGGLREQERVLSQGEHIAAAGAARILHDKPGGAMPSGHVQRGRDHETAGDVKPSPLGLEPMGQSKAPVTPPSAKSVRLATTARPTQVLQRPMRQG